MEKSILVDTLKSFSKNEIKAFIRFCDSPYYNTSSATSDLLKEIVKFYPWFEHKNFTKFFLFNKVYGNKKYSDALMRKLISNLILLSEKFLIAENNEYEDLYLLQSLNSKKLYKKFLQKIDTVLPVTNSGAINEDVFLFSSSREVERCKFYYQTNRYTEYEKSISELFVFDTLLYFYRLAQLFIRASHTSKDYPTGNEPVIISIINSIDFKKLRQELKDSEFIRKDVLFHFFDLIQLELTKEESLFYKIKDFSFEYSSFNPEETTYIGYIYLFEFIRYKLKTGERKYLFERHEIYKTLEKYSYSTTPEQMTLILFNNLFFSGIITNDISFSKSVFRKYLSLIESKKNPGLSKFYEAWIQFHRGKFVESLKLISTFNSSNFVLDDSILIPYIKRLILQLNYELGFFEEALRNLNSLLHFINTNKKISKVSKSGLRNFAQVFKQILHFKFADKEFNINALREKLSKDISVSRDWFIEKLDELQFRST